MSEDTYKLLKFVCKDERCRTVLVLTSIESVIECPECGRRYDRIAFQSAEVITGEHEKNWANKQFVRRMLILNSHPKRGTELVKVNGLSNYYCKLLSPLLTRYGMDKNTGQAKLLSEMNKGDIFDCSSFGDRAFLIDPDHIPIPGFGRDVTGSMNYLSETLKIIHASNDREERLVPIHTDGDGHCLVHAISRALVGRELFWHPLRCCLKRHFEQNLSKYQELFKDFMQPEDWQAIIEESDPDFKPPEGELHGLRNMHIFGLANVLKRPIILLDSLECMKKCGDYSALFLPGFIPPEECRGKDDALNKPICIAWSSFSHNHYIPLVGVQKRPLPVLPRALIPKVWGMPQNQVELYIESDGNGNCIIGGSRSLSEVYIQRLVHSMEDLFMEKNGVNPNLVADAKLYFCSETNGYLNVKVETVIEQTRAAAKEGRLYRCFNCKGLSEYSLNTSLFRPGSLLDTALIQAHRKLNSDASFSSKINGLQTVFDTLENNILSEIARPDLEECRFCKNSLVIRRVRPDGSLVYLPGDEVFLDHFATASKPPTNTAEKSAETDAKAKTTSFGYSDLLTIKIKWNDKFAQDSIPWTEFEELGGGFNQDSVSCLASDFTARHFPKESSNVELHLHVCDEIWNQLSHHVSIEKYKPSCSSKAVERNNSIKEEKIKSRDSSENKEKSPTTELQMVKVVSINSGQTSNLTLDKEGISYCQLQDWVLKEFRIPKENQVIKLGFPPKELEVPADPDKCKLPLNHGDRLMVENDVNSSSQRKNVINSNSLKRPSEVQDSYPSSVNSVTSEMLWKITLAKPELFQKGGAVFNSLAEKHILVDLMHLDVPLFPTKRFCYSAASDSLELCVKPLGHFRISTDVESRIDAAKKGAIVPGFSKCPQIKGPSKESVVIRPYRKPISSSEDGVPLVRKGPGFSVLTAPKPSDKMDFT